ncbi:MAG: tRNA lysidine(34) synthetase TilS [Candidatus Gracilibacteria bacterium]|nr:tRNA lysidine(34) synthetase TilS [Candidatus Gracilibacteria bacterium]
MILNLAHLKPDGKLIVAVSGGADSVYLLDLLSKQKYKLVVAHLHHGLRGKEADRDQLFVQKLAKKYKLPFETEQVDVKTFAKKQKLSIEEAARDLRYDFLHKVKDKYQAKFIVTAHTLDDQAETILMNLVRGSGLRGLTGMSVQNGDLWRPLLATSKTKILSYLKQHGLKYVEDSSNQDLFCTRNRFRLEIMPKLKAINPNLLETLNRNGLVFQEINDFLEKEARSFLKKHLHRNSFARSSFRKLPLAIQNVVIRLLHLEQAGNLLDLGFDKVCQAKEFINTAETGKQFRLSDKLTFRINYAKVDCAFPALASSPKELKKALKILGQTSFLGQKIKVSKCTKIGKLSKQSAYLDLGKTGKLYVRSFKKGDRFHPLGLKGTKKLQDFFTDQKVSVFARSSVPIIVDSRDEIVWIAGYRISEKFKAEQTSQNILKLTITSS